MSQPAIFDVGQALAAIGVLDYLQDLFTAANKETFSRVEILVVLNAVKHDPEIFDFQTVIAWDEVNGE